MRLEETNSSVGVSVCSTYTTFYITVIDTPTTYTPTITYKYPKNNWKYYWYYLIPVKRKL